MSARDNEKYFWWKKDKNYYSNHKLKALHKMKNGYAYSILLEIMKCESTPYGGILKFSDTRAYTVEELSAVADMSVKMVKNGLETLKELELITIDDSGVITINEFSNCTGYETHGSRRKKEFRNQQQNDEEGGQNADNLGTKEGQMSLESRDKSKEIRIYILNYLSSSRIQYTELGMSEDYNKAELMMIKAAEVTNILPSKERVIEMLNEIMFNETLFNRQGYLINCFKHEVNCLNENARNDN